jgi:hypothetical protein
MPNCKIKKGHFGGERFFASEATKALIVTLPMILKAYCQLPAAKAGGLVR